MHIEFFHMDCVLYCKYFCFSLIKIYGPWDCLSPLFPVSFLMSPTTKFYYSEKNKKEMQQKEIFVVLNIS